MFCWTVLSYPKASLYSEKRSRWFSLNLPLPSEHTNKQKQKPLQKTYGGYFLFYFKPLSVYSYFFRTSASPSFYCACNSLQKRLLCARPFAFHLFLVVSC
jgi:hypothetical protein